MSQSGATFLCAMSVSLDVCPTIELCYHNRNIKKVHMTIIDTYSFGIDISLYTNFIDEIKVTSNEDKMHQEMF